VAGLKPVHLSSYQLNFSGFVLLGAHREFLIGVSGKLNWSNFSQDRVVQLFTQSY
jgi:hypothetical protein